MAEGAENESISNLKKVSRVLRSDMMKAKRAYEADPQNGIDKFAFHVNLFESVLYSLLVEFEELAGRVGECDDEGMNETNLILQEVSDLILKHWSSDLKKRVEGHREREIRETLPPVKVLENHVNEKCCMFHLFV